MTAPSIAETPHGHATARPRRGEVVLAVALTMGLAALHTRMTWGYTNTFWGDVGIWMYQAEQIAGGAHVYSDVYVSNPPLGVWVVGAWARLAGTNAASIWIGTSLIFFTTVALFCGFCRSVVPRAFLVPTALVALAMAIGHAQIHGTPLPVGSYAPAAPVGFLVFLAALVFSLGPAGSRTHDAAAGAFCGLVLVGKQDFWLAALVVLAARTIWSTRAHHRFGWVPVTCAVATGAAGLAYLGIGSGWNTVIPMLTGFGHATAYGISRLLPSWEGIVRDALAAAVVLLIAVPAIAGADRRRLPIAVVTAAAVALTATYIIATFAVAEQLRSGELLAGGPVPTLRWHVEQGSNLLRPVLGYLGGRVATQIPPLLLLPIVAVLTLQRWPHLDERRHLLAFLLAVAITARVRRMFEYTEWHNVLLEVPTYALALHMFVPRARVTALAFLVLLVTIAGWVHWRRGEGPLTASGTYPAFMTHRGVVHWSSNEVRDYMMLDDALARLDPTGNRPLFSWGHNGGFAYWLRRRNPVAATLGFTTAAQPPDSTVARAIAAEPIVLDVRVYDHATVPAMRVSLTEWLQPHVLNHYVRLDRPWFDRIVRECRLVVPGPDPSGFFTLHDCSRAAFAGSSGTQ